MQIVDSYLALNALRQVGYRSTAAAVAELVDNSIEAKAKNISIITYSEMRHKNRRNVYSITEIAVLDDGKGMKLDDLSKCLSLGWGTRLETREGLGRFGFGLKGSSLSQARRVTVFSWQNSEVHSTYLDLDEIRDNQQQQLNPPQKNKLPKYITDHFRDSIKDSGTLVIWSNLDGADLSKAKTLLSRMNIELCRMYRHFLDDNDDYGKRRSIIMHELDGKENKLKKSTALHANDPLYLLTPSNLPDYENVATNEPYGKMFSISLPCSEAPSGFSDVEFRFTVAKPEIQKDLGGRSVVGKHYARNTGISFVRAGREIDFGSFGFVDSNDTRHRWWGAEVRFKPEMDELFGVTNNKQHIRGFRRLDHSFDEELIDTYTEAAGDKDSTGYEKATLILELNLIIDKNIKEMMTTIITKRQEGSRGKPIAGNSPKKKANEEFNDDPSSTSSGEAAKEKSETEKLEERIAFLLEDDETLSPEIAKTIAEKTLGYKVDLTKADWPGDTFLDTKLVANASVGIINTRSEFYQKFWDYLEQQGDSKGIDSLELLIMAFLRTEDEMARQHDPKIFTKFRERWGYWVSQLIGHAGT